MSAVKAFYSGIEGDQHFNAAVESGAIHVLTSYYYMREKNDMDILKRRHQRHPHLRFMIDSGAHSFQLDKAGKFKNWSMTDWENYLESYTDWLRANKAHVFSAVELDIESVVKSQAIIEKWQDKYFRPLEEEGIDIIYVWHPQLGFDYWEKMCAKHAYVGLPGELSKEANFNSYFTVARKWVNKIHGFAASVTGDSKLLVESDTVRRSITIGELFSECSRFEKTAEHETWGFLKDKHLTWTLDDNLRSVFLPIRAVVKHKLKKQVFEIRLRGGKTIKGTGDHSFFSLDKLGNLVEVKPIDLKVGDHLVASLGTPEGSPSTLSIEEAEFIGVWFGDGYVGKREDGKLCRICCSKQHQPVIRKLCEKIAASRNRKWSITPDGQNGAFTDLLFGEWLVDRMGREGSDKYIGPVILSADKQTQSAFLRGYFSADASAKGDNKLISLSCVRRDILDLVQVMLEQWDIRSGITDAGISGKGSRTWELAISDGESRENFTKHIGFLQKEQNEAIQAKRTDKHIAGCHRGLPVSLLRSGRLFRSVNGVLKSRPVYAKDKRTAEIPQNFCQKLLDMECEYLEITDITLISDEEVDVYDLEVPGVERFFANGILAHNTRQADYRDWPWYSIDSTSWKASEIYGLLMHWDDRRQKISYIEDKAKRALFRRDFEKYGLDAEAIIRCGIHPNASATEEEKKAYNRRSYMHITKYALITFRRMEAFYEERYKDNTQYYEMRLPHPKFLLQRIDRATAVKVWERWRPKDLFAQHAEESDPGTIRKILFGLACVQYQRLDLLGPVSRAFLQTYFASHMDAKPVNSAAVALDLALRSAPPNPQPIRRESAEDFADSAFTLHRRELTDWGELDYGPEDFPEHLLSLIQ